LKVKRFTTRHCVSIFFGDTIESLRGFNPISQRSTSEIEEAIILPASDICYPASSSAKMQRILKIFDREHSDSDWDPDKSLKIRDQIASGQRFAGMEFSFPSSILSQIESAASMISYLRIHA